jgi:hypothetical protein
LTAARHKAVVERPQRRRLARLTAPALAATLVTGTVVGISVAAADMDEPSNVAASQISTYVPAADAADRLEDRQQSVSRAAERVTLKEKPEPIGFKFATVALNVRTEPSEKSKVVDVLDFATKIAITGEKQKGFAEIVIERTAYWVSAEYLANKKPKPEKVEEESTDGSALPVGNCTAAPPSGVTSSAMAVYEAVCARFPSITTYGGYRADGEHSDGRAVDIMVSGETGWQVAEYLRANAGTFGLYDIIYSQKIWTSERSSEGWRYMEDRGSTTANHYDHVHVKVF